ncbi:hypothetical protein GNY06_00915, partial [Elizabethkingia argentiflava]
TLIEAFIVVFIVLMLFLQDFISTIITYIAVPVYIVGTFNFILLLCFTINLFTLFALVLSIGIVVEEALVVVEAVSSNIQGNTISKIVNTLMLKHNNKSKKYVTNISTGTAMSGIIVYLK